MTDPSSAAEQLQEGVRSNFLPCQKYFLRGSILATSEDVLNRLKDLCDNREGQLFNEREICLNIRASLPKNSFKVRLRKGVDEPDNLPWQLRYLGQTVIGDQNQPTATRSTLEVACSGDAIEFFTELGFELDFEYTVSGCMFLKGNMKIIISKVMSNNGNTISNSYLVELSVVVPRDKSNNLIGENMKNFAEQLEPIVQMEKFNDLAGIYDILLSI